MSQIEFYKQDESALPVALKFERPQYEVDLSLRLYKNPRLFTQELDDYHHVVYAPNHEGYPVIASPAVLSMLNQFDSSNLAGQVVAHATETGLSFTKCLHIIAQLEELGFLSAVPPLRRGTPSNFNQSPSSLSVWLHINNHCNLDCSYCFVNKFTSEMNSDTIRRVADNLSQTCRLRKIKTLTIKFAGGEPALSIPKMSEFCDVLNAALGGSSTKVRYAIISNGTIASRKFLEFLGQHRISLNISLDGFGREGHDIYRVYTKSRRGSWDKIARNIDLFIERGIFPNINATISEQSSCTLPTLVRWVAERNLNMHLGVVREIDVNGLGPSEIRARFNQLCATLNESFESAFLELEREEIIVDPVDGFSICELSFDRPATTACCGIGSNHLVIQDDGRVASCPMTIRERSSVDAMPDLVVAARETVKDWDPESRAGNDKENCLDCQWFAVCTSGCPVSNQRVFGVPFTVSPLHPFYQYVIPRYVIFYARKLMQTARRERIGSFDLLRYDGVLL